LALQELPQHWPSPQGKKWPRSLKHEERPKPENHLLKLKVLDALKARREASSLSALFKHSPFTQACASDARTATKKEAAAIVFKAMAARKV